MSEYAPRILIVDDELTVRTFVERILSEDGYFVDAVGTARQALDALCDRTFDVALVDLSLPDGDGVELIRQMRIDAPHLSILATSGFLVGDTHIRRRFDSAGQLHLDVAVVSDDRRAYRDSRRDIFWSSLKLRLYKTRGEKLSPFLISSRVHWRNVPPDVSIDVTDELSQIALPQERFPQGRR